MNKSIEVIRKLSSNGRITIPIRIRREMGLKEQDRLVFHLQDNKIVVEPKPMTLSEAYGSVKPILQPEDYDEIKRVVRDERSARAAQEDQR